MFIFLLLTTLCAAGLSCGKAGVIQYGEEIAMKLQFTKEMEESQIVMSSKEGASPKDIQAYYFTFTNDQTDIVDFELTVIEGEIPVPVTFYRYQSCEEDVAKHVLMKSGYNYDSQNNAMFPSLVFSVPTGESVHLAVAAFEEFEDGVVTVVLHQANIPEGQHNQCPQGKMIETVPFMENGYFTPSSLTELIKCNNIKINGINNNVPSYVVWYRYVGTGQAIRISTCSNYTNVDTKIVVLTSCPSDPEGAFMDCTSLADNGCPLDGRATNMYINTENGVTYYIGVMTDPEDETNEFHEGQYRLEINYLDPAQPYVCESAVEIKQLPFSLSKDIKYDWPATLDKCYGNTGDAQSVFMKFMGTGNDIVISTCNSLDASRQTIGTEIELLNDCTFSSQCMVPEDGEYGPDNCGSNMYLIQNTIKGQEYYIKAYCTQDGLTECPITVDVYEKTEKHDYCEVAYVFQDSDLYTETLTFEDMQYSYHGCGGEADKTNLGAWYKIVLSPTKEVERFKISVTNEEKDISGWIELPGGCMTYNCETDRLFGSVTIELNRENPYQYVFVYPESGSEKTILNVQIEEEVIESHADCKGTTGTIKLPYTIVSIFDDNKERLACDQSNEEGTETSYYNLRVDKNTRVEVSTDFRETTIKTGIELTSECGHESSKCLAMAGEEDRSEQIGTTLVYDVKAGDTNVITIFSFIHDHRKVRQYRMVVSSDEVPEHSSCSKPIEIDPSNNINEYTFYNKYSQWTVFEGDETRRGAFYHVKANKKMTLVVNTCGRETSGNSMIIIAQECTATKESNLETSIIKEIDRKITTSEQQCDVYGTYTSIPLEKGDERFIFIAPENSEQDTFFKITIDLDYDTSSGNTTGLVIGIIFGIWLVLTVIIIIIAAIAIIVSTILKKRKGASGMPYKRHTQEELEEHLFDEDENVNGLLEDEEEKSVDLLEF